MRVFEESLWQGLCHLLVLILVLPRCSVEGNIDVREVPPQIGNAKVDAPVAGEVDVCCKRTRNYKIAANNTLNV